MAVTISVTSNAAVAVAALSLKIALDPTAPEVVLLGLLDLVDAIEDALASGQDF